MLLVTVSLFVCSRAVGDCVSVCVHVLLVTVSLFVCSRAVGDCVSVCSCAVGDCVSVRVSMCCW